MPETYSNLDASPLPFLHLLEVLKHLDRTGWKRWIKHPEAVAAHMYRLGLMSRLAPDNVDKGRCMFIALCHDIAEAVAGDIPTYAGMSKAEKYKREEFGIRYIESLLQIANPKLGADIRAAWLEYENGNTPQATPEGQFLREIDKLECLIQAFEYEQSTYGEENLEEFQGQVRHIKSKEGKEWLELLQQERQAHFQKRKQRTPVIFIMGSSGADKKTQCDLISKEFNFQHISLIDVLREKSNDQTYLHAKFVKECLEQEVEVPIQLVINLLESKITEGISKGKMWSLVQKTNHTLFLSGSLEKMAGRSPGEGGCDSDVVDSLKTAEGYFKEIHIDGSAEEISPLLKRAVEKIIQPVEGGQQ